MSREEQAAVILGEAFPEVDSTDPVEYVSELGDAVQAVLYSFLFWPKLVEFHGAVFVALWGDDEEYISQRLTSPVSGQSYPPLGWTKVVESFNRFEVHQIFRQIRGSWEKSEETHRQLALVLVETWRARLGAAYPERSFRVWFQEGDEDMGSRIEIAQEHPALQAPRGWSDEQRAIVASA